jgi:TRAP-type uncharacterized transport system fused permease subunit
VQGPYPPDQPPFYGQPNAQIVPAPAARSFFSKNLVVALALIGILMFYIGLMILSSASFIKPPTSYSTGDYESYSDTIRGMGAGGRIVIELGGLIACIGLVCGGIAADDVSDKIRAVMVSAGIAVVISTLVVLGLFSSLGTM